MLFGRNKVHCRLLIYLSIIVISRSEYSTIIEIYHQWGILSQKCSIQYTHIVMNAETAMKFFKVFLNNHIRWSDI